MLENSHKLPVASLWWQDDRMRRVDHDPNGTAQSERPAHERTCQHDSVLENIAEPANSALGLQIGGRWLGQVVVNGGQIQEDPQVGGRINLEFLDHQMTGPRSCRPADAVDWIAGGVIADSAHSRGRNG